jgi:hypothetical protein
MRWWVLGRDAKKCLLPVFDVLGVTTLRSIVVVGAVVGAFCVATGLGGGGPEMIGVGVVATGVTNMRGTSLHLHSDACTSSDHSSSPFCRLVLFSYLNPVDFQKKNQLQILHRF